MKLWTNSNHVFSIAGLYDVCEWFIYNYPEDIFQKVKEINDIRDACKAILEKRKGEI